MKLITSTFFLALIILTIGADEAFAQTSVSFDDSEVRQAICDLYQLIQGGMGALLATAAGIGAIVASAFGLYRAGISLLVVALGSFIIPSVVSLWFGEVQCSTASADMIDQTMLKASVCQLYRFIEGAFGALVMTSAGLVAILSVAFGMYRAGYNLIITGVGAFILRALISLYFADLDCAAEQAAANQMISDAFSSGSQQQTPAP